jgi:FixJ family two-component response regulator
MSCRRREKARVPDESRISVVDDDAAVREAVKGLLKSAGFRAEAFASAEDILSSGRLTGTACLILDIRMPGMSGIEFQEQLIASGCLVPIIFITAHADEEARARALKRGAIACLPKPFGDDALLDAVAKAIGTTRLAGD